MTEREYEDEQENNIMQSVERYEDMVKNKNPLFFDQITLEELIEYFEVKNNSSKAMEVCNYALEIYPFSSTLMTKKAGLLMLHRKYNEALKWLDRAESLDSSDITIRMIRCDIYIQKTEYQKAVETVNSAFDYTDKSDKWILYLELADIYEHWRKHEKVYEYLRKAIEANPKNEEALDRIWYSVELTHKYEESVIFHQELIDRYPYSHLAWQNLGYAYYGLGMYEKAIDCHEFTIAIDETYDVAYRDIGESYFALKQYRRAIEFYQKAIHYSRPTEDLYYCIGECYERLKEYHHARLYYHRAVTLVPEFHYATYRIGVIYTKEKVWKNAVHFFRKAVKQCPESVRYIISMAQASVHLDDADTLLDACNRVLELSVRSRSRQTLERLISFLIRLNLVNEAEVLADYAMMEKGTHSSLVMLKSVCLFRSGCRKQAKEYLEMSLTLDKNKRQLLFRLMPQLIYDAEVAEIVDIYR